MAKCTPFSSRPGIARSRDMVEPPRQHYRIVFAQQVVHAHVHTHVRIAAEYDALLLPSA